MDECGKSNFRGGSRWEESFYLLAVLDCQRGAQYVVDDSMLALAKSLKPALAGQTWQCNAD